MFALSVELLEASLNDEDRSLLFEPLLHVDRGVQVEESQLELRITSASPPPTLQPSSDDAEIAAVAPAPAAGAASSSSRPSPYPRRSDGASPWLDELDDESDDEAGTDAGDDEVCNEEEEGGEEEDTDAEGSAGGRPRLELAKAAFLAGPPTGEVLAGSIGFYRYDEPAGFFGLRPPPLRSNVVCLMAVPSWMSSSELLRWVGGYTRYVRLMRLLRDASMPHRHMLLLQFGSPAVAERFRADYHGKRFSSLEPEVALAVHVAQVVFGTARKQSTGEGADSGDRAAEPPPVHLRLHVNSRTHRGLEGDSAEVCAVCEEGGTDTEGKEKPTATADNAGGSTVRAQLWLGSHAPGHQRAPHVDASATAPPLLPPTVEEKVILSRARRGYRSSLPPLGESTLLGSAVELPGCPVCLERLDPSISGVVTIVCDHTFHCECLRRWADSSCPVCRHVADDSQTATCCEVCGTTESLWICLVCGHVGCGRYSGCGSGLHHNEATDHNFAMELATQRVWDYKGDNYVHRLIQNKVDGKLVELPDAKTSRGGGSSVADGMGRDAAAAAQEMKQRGQEEQYEAVVHEYSLLLTGQLEVQRRHFEERLAELERAHKRQLLEAEGDMQVREEALRREHEAVEREARASAKRMQSAQKAVSERDFNKQLNEQLMRNQGDLREQLQAAEQRESTLKLNLADMEEQLRDMTFHFESQIKILQAGAGAVAGEASELSGGAVIAPDVTPSPPSARGKRKAKKGA
jgi:hypothetical protein